jgi:hypothetical protein
VHPASTATATVAASARHLMARSLAIGAAACKPTR